MRAGMAMAIGVLIGGVGGAAAVRAAGAGAGGGENDCYTAANRALDGMLLSERGLFARSSDPCDSVYLKDDIERLVQIANWWVIYMDAYKSPRRQEFSRLGDAINELRDQIRRRAEDCRR